MFCRFVDFLIWVFVVISFDVVVMNCVFMILVWLCFFVVVGLCCCWWWLWCVWFFWGCWDWVVFCYRCSVFRCWWSSWFVVLCEWIVDLFGVVMCVVVFVGFVWRCWVGFVCGDWFYGWWCRFVWSCLWFWIGGLVCWRMRDWCRFCCWLGSRRGWLLLCWICRWSLWFGWIGLVWVFGSFDLFVERVSFRGFWCLLGWCLWIYWVCCVVVLREFCGVCFVLMFVCCWGFEVVVLDCCW